MRACILDLWLESLRVPISNVAPCCSYLIQILLQIMTILARTILITESALSEALTVHLQTLGT